MRKIKEFDIDNPAHRHELANQTGIRVKGPIPRYILNQATVIISNYLGEEDDLPDQPCPDLQKSIDALICLTNAISGEGLNRLLAIGRERASESMTDQGLAKSLQPVLTEAVKGKDGRYRLNARNAVKVKWHLRENGVLWAAPGGTTRDRGLRHDVQTGAVRLAIGGNYHLVGLAMQTDEEDKKVKSIEIVEIDAPQIEFRKQALKGVIRKQPDKKIAITTYHALTIGGLARVAEVLPPGFQRGEFRDPERILHQAKCMLWGLEREGVRATGGFMDEG